MKKRILNYIATTNEIIMDDNPSTDWNEILSAHLDQISFFQHERLVHLIVTVSFGLILVLILNLMLLTNEFSVFICTLMVFIIMAVTLIFYIFHYFLLENNVQKLYQQYDEILRKKVSSELIKS